MIYLKMYVALTWATDFSNCAEGIILLHDLVLALPAMPRNMSKSLQNRALQAFVLGWYSLVFLSIAIN